MKKVAYCASTFSHIRNFHMPYIKQLVADGHEVIVIAGGKPMQLPDVSKCITIPFEKKLLSLQNISAVYQLRKVLKQEACDVVHVHTSLAAALLRLSLHGYRDRPYMINMVHGYLFGKNYSKVKNTIYLAIEKYLKRYTDMMIVMNEEDYQIATTHRLYKEELYKIDGMGVGMDTWFRQGDGAITRESIGLEEEDTVLVFAGEFSHRKNQQCLIKAVQQLPKHYKLLLLGTGDTLDACRQLIKEYSLGERVYLLGYQTNVQAYYNISDVCVSASKSEGLPFNIVEAMACSLPVIASGVKGHEDLIAAEWLFDYDAPEMLCEKLKQLEQVTKQDVGRHNKQKAMQYSLEEVFDKNYEILRKKL